MSLSSLTKEECVDLILSGKFDSLESLGDHYNVSKERVRQILNNLGINSRCFQKIKNYNSFTKFKNKNPSYEPEGVIWKQAIVNGDVLSKTEISEDGEVRDLICREFGDFKYTFFRKRTLHCGVDKYFKVCLNGSSKYIHRIVAETFLDKEEGKDYVNHLDGNKHNNNRYNLEWCTPKENFSHAMNHIKVHPFKNNSEVKSKSYKITYSSGEIETIHNLNKWAKDKDYSQECIRLILCGKQNTHKDIISVEKVL